MQLNQTTLKDKSITYIHSEEKESEVTGNKYPSFTLLVQTAVFLSEIQIFKRQLAFFRCYGLGFFPRFYFSSLFRVKGNVHLTI